MKACHNCMHWPVCNMREDDNACGYYKPQEKMRVKPITNADRIRAMSDEQLAEFIYKAFCQEYFPKQYLEWLRQPAEEERDG